MGLERAGMICVGQVEINTFCQAVLKKHWPNVKRMSDIREVKGNEFGTVDLVCGGFPCQPFSCAGKRRGKEDDRYLWPEMVRVIETVRPSWVIGENVAGIVNMALDTVLSDLEAQGYQCEAFIIPACAVGAVHRRDRVWIIGNTKGCSIESQREICGRQNTDSAGSVGNDTNSGNTGLQGDKQPGTPEQRAGASRSASEFYKDASDTKSQQAQSAEPGRFYTESGFPNWGAEWPEVAAYLCGMDDGVSGRVDRLKALGNAVVPQIVEEIGRQILHIEQERLEI